MTIHEHRTLPATRRPDEPAPALTTVDRVLIRIAEQQNRADRALDRLVVGPNGQNLTVREAYLREKELNARIEEDEEQLGNLRHRRVGPLTRVLTLGTIAVVDLPIMLWLASSVFNVDWTHPAGLPLVISVVVSLLATGGAATALHHLGHNQREHKNDRRQLDWAELTASGRLSLVSVGLLIGLMGVLMFVRVDTEGVLSGLTDLAALMAVLVAVVLVISACLVFWTAFRDGSLVQDDLRHYSRIVRRHLRDQRRHLEHAQDLRATLDRLRPPSR